MQETVVLSLESNVQSEFLTIECCIYTVAGRGAVQGVQGRSIPRSPPSIPRVVVQVTYHHTLHSRPGFYGFRVNRSPHGCRVLGRVFPCSVKQPASDAPPAVETETHVSGCI